MAAHKLIFELGALADKKQSTILQKFFKTGRGEYGEGDISLGIKVPVIRATAKKYCALDLKEIQKLLDSKIHDIRQAGLFILVAKYEKVKKQNLLDRQKEIVKFYLANTNAINNWDLVDLTAPKILGDYLVDKKSERNVLYDLAVSEKKVLMDSCGFGKKESQLFQLTRLFARMILKILCVYQKCFLHKNTI